MNRFLCAFLSTAIVTLTFVGCGPGELPRQELSTGQGELTIHGDVWADNWFKLYLGDEPLIEDSVSIKTERSFNAESFSFKADYPIVLNFIVKDFKENDTGLEYIGTPRQQLGDGGFIAQFKDAKSGKTIGVTNAKWKCFVLHHGPMDEAAAEDKSPVAGEGHSAFVATDEPEGWKSADFSTDDWQDAKVFTASEVGPKEGYDQIAWDKDAKLIWADDLKKDNTILFRYVIEGPE